MTARTFHTALSAALLCGVATAALAQPAPRAASAGDAVQQANAVEEIVVTARRRDENAQDVPIALTVVSSETLAASGAFTLGQVQQISPSLQVFSFNPRNTNVNIRALGSNVAFSNDGLENGVGIYIDNVYFGRLGQSQFDLVDLQQIEVLRGPQGTLFGKNTTAGAINITSQAPSFTPEGSAEATIGDYGYSQLRASVSGPLGDKAAARLSLAQTKRDGFLENVRTGQDLQDYENFTARGQLLLRPSDDLSIRLIADYSKQAALCCVASVVDAFDTYDSGGRIANNFTDRVTRAGYAPLPFEPFERKTDIDAPVQANMRGYGLSGQVDWDLPGARLTSITAYRWWNWDPANDSDSLGLPILTLAQTANRQRQFSQEVRLASEGDNTVDYVVGAYYFWQVIRGYGRVRYGSAAASFNLPGVPTVLGDAALNGFESNSYTDPETKSYALFGQATWNISDELKLTGGLRYTHEDKRGSFRQWHADGPDLGGLPPALAAAAIAIRGQFAPLADYGVKFSDDNLSGLVSLSYAPTSDLMFYGSYSHGAKSGGLNLAILPPGISPQVDPEGVDAFELGLKSQWFDRTLTANLALFHTTITDYQTAIIEIQQDSVTALQYIDNIPKVRSQGVEGDVAWTPAAWLSLTGSFAYTDASYREYANALQAPENLDLGPQQDLSGKRLSGSSKLTYTLGADVSWPVPDLGGRAAEVYAHGDYSHRSSYYTSASNSRYTLVPGYGLLNARVGLRTTDGLWDISAWARNLGDEDYFQTLSVSNYGLVTGQLGDPQTYGVTLRSRF
jgi:iron complex outermembrane receptor protein